MRKANLGLITAIFLAVVAIRPAAAQACSDVDWQEHRTEHFAVIFQAGAEPGQSLAGDFGDTLDAEYERFSALFDASLLQPVSIRVYPTEANYFCLNVLASEIPDEGFHSRLGSREIVLIAENIENRPDEWQLGALDSLRYELVALFVNEVSGGKAPPGLLIGQSIYAQDPLLTFERRFAADPAPVSAPGASWRTLWESSGTDGVPGHGLQSASITAFLLDVYGWDAWLAYLKALPTAENWRQALAGAYPAGPGELEKTWSEQFYPLYFAGRWRTNLLYNFSLKPYQDLIAAGAYQAAADGLAEAIALLTTLEDFDALSSAQELNVRALNGLTAEDLARQARQAYSQEEFQNARDLANQANQIYADLGDARNTQALNTYAERAAEILALRAELESLGGDLGLIGGALNAGRIIEIGGRLDELGDQTGKNRAGFLLESINRRQLSQGIFVAVAGAGLALLLLGHRIRLVRTNPPDEVLLQN